MNQIILQKDGFKIGSLARRVAYAQGFGGLKKGVFGDSRKRNG